MNSPLVGLFPWLVKDCSSRQRDFTVEGRKVKTSWFKGILGLAEGGGAGEKGIRDLIRNDSDSNRKLRVLFIFPAVPFFLICFRTEHFLQL